MRLVVTLRDGTRREIELDGSSSTFIETVS